jgi:hypothetical protein
VKAPPTVPCFTDEAELAVDGARLAEALGVPLEPTIVADPFAAAEAALSEAPVVGVAIAAPVDDRSLARFAMRCRSLEGRAVLAVLGDAAAARHLALDLGLPAVDEVEPLLAALALLQSGAKRPWQATARGVSALDRQRLGDVLRPGRGGGQLRRGDEGGLAWAARAAGPHVALGRPADVGRALSALRVAAEASPPARAVLEGVDERAVEDVLFGPPRELSDPASKTALDPYGVPLPLEELCASPSRAASEASRLGFPVRLSLASPDLRVWDHPDLAVDAIETAARVREAYRQILALAQDREPDARLLGVQVTATTVAVATLSVRLRALPAGVVRLDLGFADAHGTAAGDRTVAALPTDEAGVERILGRLRGADLLLQGSAAQRRAVVGSLTDLFLRLTAFVDRYRAEVASVRIEPVAVLVGGAVEVREACVTVTDAYQRSLEAPPAVRRSADRG